MTTYNIRKILSIFSAIYVTSIVGTILVSYGNVKEQDEVDILKNKINNKIANNYHLEESNILQNDIEKTIQKKINALNTNKTIKLKFAFSNHNKGSIKVVITIIKRAKKAAITKIFSFDYQKLITAKVKAFKNNVTNLKDYIVIKNGSKVPMQPEAIEAVMDEITAAKTELQKDTSDLDVTVTNESFTPGEAGQKGNIKAKLIIKSGNNPIDTITKIFTWKNLSIKQQEESQQFFATVKRDIENNIVVNEGKVPNSAQEVLAFINKKVNETKNKRNIDEKNPLDVKITEENNSFNAGLPGQEGKIIVRFTIKRNNDEISKLTKTFTWTNLTNEQNNKLAAFEQEVDNKSKENINPPTSDKEALNAVTNAVLNAKNVLEDESGLSVSTTKESFTAGAAGAEGSIVVLFTIKRETNTIKIITKKFKWTNLNSDQKSKLAAFEVELENKSNSKIVVNEGNVPTTEREALNAVEAEIKNAKTALEKNTGLKVNIPSKADSFTADTPGKNGSIKVIFTIKKGDDTIKTITKTFTWKNNSNSR